MERLKQARLNAGYTIQHKFAQRIGLSPSDYNRLERGKFNPLPETYRDICHLCNAAPEDIARPCDVDYGLPASKPTRKRKDAHKPKFSPRMEPDDFIEAERNRAELGMTQAEYMRFCNKLARQEIERRAKKGRVA